MALFDNNISITGTNDFNPNFIWQVGSLGPTNQVSQLQFRATIRPLTTFESINRIPNQVVLYEETGILLNNQNLGNWSFTLDKNINTVGGPYRDYQLVIEAHDNLGNTSAGNLVGTSNEQGWTAYPLGYDIIAITNPRQTGIELSNNLTTQITGNSLFYSGGTGFSSRQFIDGNGGVTIRFISGSFTSDLVGGFIYTSPTPFPKLEAQINTGYWGTRVQKSRFDFTPEVGFVHQPSAAFNIRGAPVGYVSVSFFDELDRILLDEQNIDISTGLYLSNNALIFNDAAVGTISLGGGTTIAAVTTTGFPALNSDRTNQLIGSGVEITRSSTAGTLEAEGNITTIIYMSRPINNYYTGANGNIILNNLYQSNGGLGSDAVSFPFGNDNAGGFSGDSLVLTLSNDGVSSVPKKISQIQIGDKVKSYRYSNFDYRADNWNTVPVTNTNSNPPPFSWNDSRYHSTGIVTNIHINTINSYFILNKDISTQFYTSPQAIFLNNNANIPTLQKIFLQSQFLYYLLGGHIWGARTTNGLTPSPINLNNVTLINQSLTVYHLEVEPFKTFYIINPNQLDAYLVHDAVTDYPIS